MACHSTGIPVPLRCCNLTGHWFAGLMLFYWFTAGQLVCWATDFKLLICYSAVQLAVFSSSASLLVCCSFGLLVYCLFTGQLVSWLLNCWMRFRHAKRAANEEEASETAGEVRAGQARRLLRNHLHHKLVQLSPHLLPGPGCPPSSLQGSAPGAFERFSFGGWQFDHSSTRNRSNSSSS